MQQNEHNLQVVCVTWFRYGYPEYKMLLFAIPNGGMRNKITAKKLRAEGVVAGVADLFLAVPNKNYHGLFIEMKYGKNKQTEYQKEFEKSVKQQGYDYKLVYTFDQFRDVINEYLL